MHIETRQLESKELFVVGSKLPAEETFFLQIVDEKRKQYLWNKFMHMKPEMDYYIHPITLPYKQPDAPF